MRATGCLVLVACAAPAPVVPAPAPVPVIDAYVAIVCPESNVPVNELGGIDGSRMSIGHPTLPHVTTDVVEHSPSINLELLYCDLANRSDRLRSCYYDQAVHRAGVVTLAFRIAQDGSTTMTTPPATPLEDCFARSIMTSTFTKPRVAGDVTLSITLEPGS